MIAAEGIYLFCLARQDVLPAVEALGLEAGPPIVSLAHEQVSAVVSRVSLEEWTGPVGEANLQDLKWVAPLACRHQAIIKRVMKRGAVLPVGFGTIFSSLERIVELMDAHQHRILSFLDLVTGREEWALKGFLDVEVVEQNLMASDERMSSLPASPGARYLLERRIRAAAKKRARDWSREVSSTIAATVLPLAEKARPLKCLPREVSGRDLDMIFNGALLMDHSALGQLCASTDELRSEHIHLGLTLELSGPWPPYSFSPEFGGEAVS